MDGSKFNQGLGNAPLGLLYTDAEGQVVFANWHFYHMMNYDRDHEIIGKPVHEALRIDRKTAATLLATGRQSTAPTTLFELPGATASGEDILCSCEAAYDDRQNFIGTNLHLALASSGDYIGTEPDPKVVLHTYITFQINALQVALARMAGQRVHDALEDIVNEMAQRYGWSISIRDGLLSSGLDDAQADVAAYANAYRALLAKVVDYATNVVGPHLVGREMQAVDDKIAPQALDLVNRFGLGGLHDSL